MTKKEKTIVEKRYPPIFRRKLNKTARIHWGWLKESTDGLHSVVVTKLLGHLEHQKVNMISQLSSPKASEMASGKR